jgi:uncharacterized protein YnzC (UPF0291/DUF896 family)
MSRQLSSSTNASADVKRVTLAELEQIVHDPTISAEKHRDARRFVQAWREMECAKHLKPFQKAINRLYLEAIRLIVKHQLQVVEVDDLHRYSLRRYYLPHLRCVVTSVIYDTGAEPVILDADVANDLTCERMLASLEADLKRRS